MGKAPISIRMATYSCHESTLVHVRIEGLRSGHKLNRLPQPASVLVSSFDSWGQDDGFTKCVNKSVTTAVSFQRLDQKQ